MFQRIWTSEQISESEELKTASDDRIASIIGTEDADGQGVDEEEDSQSEPEQLEDEPLPESCLEIKRIDHYYGVWKKTWKARESEAKSGSWFRPAQDSSLEMMFKADDNPWDAYCFVVVHHVARTDPERSNYDLKEDVWYIHIKNPYLIDACKRVGVLKQDALYGVALNVPSEIKLDIFLSCLPRFEAYRDLLRFQEQRLLTEREKRTISSLDVLIKHLRTDYAHELSTLISLISSGMITFSLLQLIFPPNAIVLARSPHTGELEAYQLLELAHRDAYDRTKEAYHIPCRYIDRAEDPQVKAEQAGLHWFDRAFRIELFDGIRSITSLPIYPLHLHPDPGMREKLLTRGKKWVSMDGIRHVHYKGPGITRAEYRARKKIAHFNVDGRVIIDGLTFKRHFSGFAFEKPSSSGPNLKPLDPSALTEDELIVTSPILYGFSLTHKLWLILDAGKISDIKWDPTAFDNLVLPEDRKEVLRSLVMAHKKDKGTYESDIRGKGQGLIINLHGPPGNGKTLTAEAITEILHKPLYVVTLGDLSVNYAWILERNLGHVFQLASAWDAVVLVDEADVFLQERSMQDLRRTTMISIFLRNLEYFRGVLFLTTNRVEAYDTAVQSRIHVSLAFPLLPQSARKQIWANFLRRITEADRSRTDLIAGTSGGQPSEDELDFLSTRPLNGREIKNVVRTAQSLACVRAERFSYKIVAEVLEVLDESDLRVTRS